MLSDPAASQAVLMGSAVYTTLDQLPAVENNLTGLQAALTNPAIWGLPAGHCTVLQQPDSAYTVLNTLQQAAASATDTLVVYFAGHGLIDHDDDELYLALPGSDVERAYLTAVSYAWVRKEMRKARVRRKVVILDCCYSGLALGHWMAAGQADLTGRLEIEGTCVLTATASTRKALAPPGERFTAFTGELLTILTEGIVGGPDLLDMDTLYQHLETRLRAKNRPVPQRGQLDRGGNIAMARNRTPAKRHAPAPRPVRAGHLLHTLAGHTDQVYGVAFSPDGPLLATASRDKTAQLWNAATGETMHTLAGHAEAVYGVAFSSDGALLATASGDKTAQLWDTATGECIHILTGHASYVLAAAFSPRNALIATASSDTTVRLWDTVTGAPVRTLTGHTSLVYGVTFSSDGTLLASASNDTTARLWNPVNGENVRTLGHAKWVFGVAFSSDGALLATASRDKTAQLWDTATGENVGALTGHTDDVRGVAFSPDDSLIVTASYDTTARLWNPANGENVRTLGGHADRVYGVAFSADGTLVATASGDKTARLWS